jgi:hypothetical protein
MTEGFSRKASAPFNQARHHHTILTSPARPPCARSLVSAFPRTLDELLEDRTASTPASGERQPRFGEMLRQQR